jgi:glyoxylase-like metal-dependent hydrolase (beta-lactamase superfamily II)
MLDVYIDNMSTIKTDWGSWLPRDVEAASPNTVAIWYLGCNGFFLKGNEGTTIAIDPYVGTGDPPRTVRMIPVPFDPGDITTMDAVLATHEHTDHTHGPSQGPILESTDARFYAPDDSIDVARETEAWQDEYDINETQLQVISEGDTMMILTRSGMHMILTLGYLHLAQLVISMIKTLVNLSEQNGMQLKTRLSVQQQPSILTGFFQVIGTCGKD